MSEQLTHAELLSLATQIVAGYVSNHQVEVTDFKRLVQSAYQAISENGRVHYSSRGLGPLSPAVPIEESINEDYIVCLEDGKRLQMLKRHLKTVYKMSIEQYKERWGLPHDYPVVAPSYAKRRSQIAKNTGLGMTGRRRRVKEVVIDNDGVRQVAMVVNK